MREARPRHLQRARGGGAEAGRAAALTCGRRRRPGAPSPAGWNSWRRRSRSPSPAAAAAAGRARPGPGPHPPARAAASRTARWRSQVTPAAPPPLGKGFLYGTAVNQDGGRQTAAAILAEAPPYGADATGRGEKGEGGIAPGTARLPPRRRRTSASRRVRSVRGGRAVKGVSERGGRGELPPPRGERGGARPAPYNTMVAPVPWNFLWSTRYRPLLPAPRGAGRALTRRHAASPSLSSAADPTPLPSPRRPSVRQNGSPQCAGEAARRTEP